MESPRGRVSIQKKKYCHGTCPVLFQGLEFLEKPKGVPHPAAPLPTGLLPPSPCSQPPEVPGTQWSLSQGCAEGWSWSRLEKQGNGWGRKGDAGGWRCSHVKTAEVIPSGRALDEQIPLFGGDYIW